MNFLSPLFILVGLLAIPILLLYVLKLRREDRLVSSTMLWQMVLEDRQANSPWQRLRRNLLLIVQLLVLFVLVAALLRPAFPGGVISNAQVIVILDATASMQATDVAPSRFDAAKDAIAAIIADLPAQSEMTLVLASAQPSTLLTHSRDKQALRRALDGATAGAGEANWGAALALAHAAISLPDHLLVLVSDGGWPDGELVFFSERLKHITVGSGQENLGITAFSVASTQTGAELFVKVRNYGVMQKTTLLSVYREGALLQADRIQIPPGGEHATVVAGLSKEPARYRVQLAPDVTVPQNDLLPIDDQAYFIFNPTAGKRVLLVSEGNFFLEQVLAALPEIEAFQSFPAAAESGVALPGDPFAVYIFDGSFPETLPAGSLLLINPPPNPLFPVGPTTSNFGSMEVLAHPLTQHISWDQIQIQEIKPIELPLWADVLVNSDTGPLVFVGEHQARRIAVLAFDLLASDLPLHITFPILFDSLLAFLNPPVMYDAPHGYQVGEAVHLKPGPTVERLVVELPDGREQPLEIGERGATFLATDQIGVYTLTTQPGGHTEQFAVNSFSPVESSILPQAPGLTAIPDAQAPGSTPQVGYREIWPQVALLAIPLLGVEWWLYYRRAAPHRPFQEKRTP